MFIIITIGIIIIIAIIIITIVIKCACNNNNRTPQESYPHFDANSIPPNYGYTSSKAHQGSSWACTFKGGEQVNTHIWETPLPEPHEGEYTLPASMKKQLGMGDQTGQKQPASVSAGIDWATHHPELRLNVKPSDNIVETTQAQYTMPEKLRSVQQQCAPVLTLSESEYTMPVKMKERSNPTASSMTSDYTIPVLPQPVPDTPDSESEYTKPICLNVSHQKEPPVNMRSSLQQFL